MNSLFNVVVFDIGKLPHITRVFTFRIPGQFANIWPLEMALSGVFRRHLYRIKVPGVIIRLRPPVNGFVTTRQSSCTVQSVTKVPNDPVAELEAMITEDGIQKRIDRYDLSIYDIVSNLPANLTFLVQKPDTLGNYLLLQSKVVVKWSFAFIFLTQIVRWRRDNQLERIIRDVLYESKIVPTHKNRLAY